MRGFPKYINSRGDLDNCAELFPAETVEFINDILEFKDVWIAVAKLGDDDEGITDATHKVVDVKDNNGVVTERYQYELMEDPSENGPIKRYGFANGAEMREYMQRIAG